MLATLAFSLSDHSAGCHRRHHQLNLTVRCHLSTSRPQILRQSDSRRIVKYSDWKGLRELHSHLDLERQMLQAKVRGSPGK